jgi:glycosyltransferase involved in cell wall biosynthesis
MTETKPKLSICIPTYNRPSQLFRLITEILGQIKKISPNSLEFIIVDDSDVINNDVERLLINANLPFNYIRGKANGIDSAIIKILEHAKGEYVWWCGDDDQIADNFIETIFSVLKNPPQKIGYIFCSYVIGRLDGLSKARYRYISAESLLNEIGIDITLLTSGIFNRALGVKAIELAKKYVGSAFASQPILFAAMFPVGERISCCVIDTPLILNNPTILEKKGLFYDGVNAFGVNYWSILGEYSNSIPASVRSKFLKRTFGHIWRGLIIDWIKRDIPSPRNRLYDLRKYAVFHEYWLAAFIFMMPKCAVKFFYRIYKFFNPASYSSK